MNAEFSEILNGFALAIHAAQPVSAPLCRLLASTGSRAVGFWRLVGGELELLGFEAVDDMPAEVRTGFAAATARVPLDQIRLGCVQAAVSRQPTVATCGEPGSGLVQSAGWIARFGAVQSLAVPIVHELEVVGVLAISTPYSFDVNHASWQLVLQLADGLAPLLHLWTCANGQRAAATVVQ